MKLWQFGEYCITRSFIICKKVKISLFQAMEAHRVARG
jgi:hypothetical protein